MPAVGVAPTAVADELHALVDGTLDGRGSGIGGRVKNRVHRGVAVSQHLIAQPAGHEDRGRRTQAAFRVVSGHGQAAPHPGGVGHRGCFFMEDGLASDGHKLRHIVEGEASHQHFREIVVSFEHGVLMVVRVVFRVFRRGEEGCGDGIISADVAKEEQIIAVVLVVVVQNVGLELVERGADVRFVGHIDVEALGALPTDEIGLVTGQRAVADDQHLGPGNGQVAQIRGLKVVRQFLVGIYESGGDAGWQGDGVASGQREFSVLEGADRVPFSELSFDQDGEALHFAEGEDFADAQGVDAPVQFRIKEIPALVKHIPFQGLDLQIGGTVGQGESFGNQGTLGKFLIGIHRLRGRSQPDVFQPGGQHIGAALVKSAGSSAKYARRQQDG